MEGCPPEGGWQQTHGDTERCAGRKWPCAERCSRLTAGLWVRSVGKGLREHPISSGPFLRGREPCWRPGSPKGSAGGGSVRAPFPRVCVSVFCCWNAAVLPTGVGNRKVNVMVGAVRSGSAAWHRWRMR